MVGCPTFEYLSFRNCACARVKDDFFDFCCSICRFDIHRFDVCASIFEVYCQSRHNSFYHNVNREALCLELCFGACCCCIEIYVLDYICISVVVDVNYAMISVCIKRCRIQFNSYLLQGLNLFAVLVIESNVDCSDSFNIVDNALYRVDYFCFLDSIDLHGSSLGECSLRCVHINVDLVSIACELLSVHRIFCLGLVFGVFFCLSLFLGVVACGFIFFVRRFGYFGFGFFCFVRNLRGFVNRCRFVLLVFWLIHFLLVLGRCGYLGLSLLSLRFVAVALLGLRDFIIGRWGLCLIVNDVSGFVSWILIGSFDCSCCLIFYLRHIVLSKGHAVEGGGAELEGHENGQCNN